MITVAFLADPRGLVTSMTLPAEMFLAAEDLSRTARRNQARLRLVTATLDDQSFLSPAGVSLEPEIEVDRLADVDLLYLPSIWRSPRSVLRRAKPLLPVLARLRNNGAILCAVGTGSYLIAEAGLLEGKPATTHWYFAEDFARRYPTIEVKRDHLITRAGRLYCAASINSVADLTVHFIERFYGARIARQVEAQFSPEVRRPFSDRVFSDGDINSHADELMADAQLWLEERFSGDCRIDQLASSIGVSRRTLNRRFLRASGMTPVRFLHRLRVRHACKLLRDSNLRVGEVASRVGIPDAGYFSAVFRRQMAQSPSAYRRSVRSKLFSAFDPADGSER